MKKIVSLLLFIGSTVLFAQQKTHKVAAKETVYGISKKYGVTQDALYKANPTIEKNGLQIGDLINIPNEKEEVVKQPIVETTEDDNFIYYTIQPKDNLYQLSKKYNVSEATLKSLNQKQVETGLKVGDILIVPKKETTSTAVKTTKVSIPEGSYLVTKGETLYTLAKKLDVSVDDLYAENPLLQTEGLKEGQILIVPKKSGRSNIDNNTINYLVQSGDSAYDIINRYNTTLDELIALNPTVIDGLKAGMILKLPLQKNAKIIKYAEAGKVKRVNDNEINIVLMLPFNSENQSALKNNQAMQFFTGAKVALTRLAKSGKNINVKVLDTKNDTDVQGVLAATDLSKTDAIIGPLKAGGVIEVAEFLKGSGIGIVSPLANAEDLNIYENLLIANPREEVLADQIINEVKGNFKGEQVYLLADSEHSDLAKYTKKELEKQLNANVVIVNDANKIIQPNDKVEGVDYFTPITAIMVGDNEVLAKQFLNRLKSFNKDYVNAYGIKSTSVYDIYDADNAGNIDAFREFGFVFSTSHIMNTREEETVSILNDFKNVYCNIPTRMEQLGYDTVYDIVDRMNSKGDFLNNVVAENTRLATKFAYKKVDKSKAYANDSARLIRLPKK
jgi:peptidoglycan DL-endopeptidase LytF